VRPLAILALLLSACGGDAAPIDPHAPAPCDQAWTANGFTDCEAACADSGPVLFAMGPACQAQTATGPIACNKTFVFGGVTGCCSSSRPQLLFGECE
jgi:hypothetical protein